MRDSFIFYRSFYEAIKDLPRDVQGEIYTAIMEYSLYGNKTDGLKPIAHSIFTLMKPQIDVNNKRFENGKKGGRPKVQDGQRENHDETGTEPNVDDNVNEDDNANADAGMAVDAGEIQDTPSPPSKGGCGRKKKEIASVNSKARKLFEDYFKKTFSCDYYWTAKDAGNMSRLLKKLTFSRKQKELPVDDDSVLYALRIFLSSIKEGWIFEHFSVANINSQFNGIVSQARNGNNSKPDGRPEEKSAGIRSITFGGNGAQAVE